MLFNMAAPVTAKACARERWGSDSIGWREVVARQSSPFVSDGSTSWLRTGGILCDTDMER